MSHKTSRGEDMEDVTSADSTNTEDQNQQKEDDYTLPTAKVKLNSSIENELEQHMVNLQLVRQTENENVTNIPSEQDANMLDFNSTHEQYDESERLKHKRSSEYVSTDEPVGSTVDNKRIKLI